MAFVSKNTRPKIGDKVITKKKHESMSGIFEVGSEVEVYDICEDRGYAIKDEEGNKMCEIGWTI